MCSSFVSSTNGPKTLAWYQDASRKVGILVCNPDYDIGDVLESDAGFVWDFSLR